MWWHAPLILALGRQRQADFLVQGQPGLQSEFQDRQGYTEKPCLKKRKKDRKDGRNKGRKEGRKEGERERERERKRLTRMFNEPISCDKKYYMTLRAR